MLSIKQILKSALVRKSANLLTAGVVAQVIGFVVYIFLARIYSTADFGLLSLFTSIGGVLALFATAEYQYAIVLPRDDKRAASVLYLGIVLLLCSVLLIALSGIWAESIAGYFSTPELVPYYRYGMPIFVLLIGLWNIFNYWYMRTCAFGRIASYQVTQSVASSVLKIGIGKSFYTGGLIWGTIIGQVVSVLTHLPWRSFPKWQQRSELKSVAAEYRNFPLYNLPRSVVNYVVGQLPVFWLTPVFGDSQVGYWGMAVMLGFAPVSMICRAIYQVLYQHVSAAVNNRQSILPLFRHFTLGCLAIGIPGFALLYFLLPWLVTLLYGEQWLETAFLIRWMLPWVLLSILTGSTAFLSDVFMKQRVGLAFELLMAFLRIIGVGLGVWFHSFTLAIAGYAMGSAIAQVAQFIWMMWLVARYEHNLA